MSRVLSANRCSEKPFHSCSKGIAEHAVRTDGAAYEAFRAEIERIEGHSEEPAGLRSAAATAVAALSRYNQQQERVFQRRAAEVRNVAWLLAEAISLLVDGSACSSPSPREIVADLEHAVCVKDIQHIRLRLSECLTRLREDAALRNHATERTIAALRDRLARHDTSDMDSVTGLPDRAAAEALFQKLYADGERKYVLTVVTDRLQSIHSRFGSTACDAVMKIMAEYVSQRLPDATGVFKWSDSAIVAVLHRKDMIDRVRAELRGVLDRVIHPTIDVDNRSVLIPLTLSWSLVGLVPPRPLVTRHIDSFIANQVPYDYC